MIRRGALAAAAAGLALLASVVLAACGTTSTTPRTTPTATPTAAPASNLDCLPTVAPTPSPSADVPRIVAIRNQDCELTPGGPPARFGVEVTNPTAHGVRAGLSFTLSWGLKADALRLEHHDDAGWHRLTMTWISQDEPEALQSEPAPVRLRPHETRTYRLRVSVPRTYEPEYGLVAFSAMAKLDLGDKGHRDDSFVPGPVFALNPPKDSPVNLSLPGRPVTPGGGPVEFTATVDNTTGRSLRRVGLSLDLSIDQAAARHLRLEVRRRGGWHRLTLVRGENEYSVSTSPAADAALPPGYHHKYRFRLTLRPGAVRGSPLVSFSLRDRTRPGSGASPGRGADLGTAYRKLHVSLPTVHIRTPKEVTVPGSADLAVGFVNDTGVSLPPVHLRLTVTNPALRAWFTVLTRRSGSGGPWTRLRAHAAPDGFHAWTVDLPAPRDGSTPAGFRADHEVRIQLSTWDLEVANMLHVAAQVVLADGTPVSASTEGDTEHAYIGVSTR